jgi:gamma-glutamyltranspeptidase / glutathione hydrolase
MFSRSRRAPRFFVAAWIVAAMGGWACRGRQTPPAQSPQDSPPAAASVPMKPAGPLRPPVMGPNAAVSTGHPLATAAALEVLMKGGNAFDAGVAAMLVCGVVEQDLYSLGGEGAALVYPRAAGKVIAVNGVGWTPKGATLESYLAQGKTMAGVGLDPAVVPGVLHSALTILERWGTMSFEQVSARAIEYAGQGFPLRPRTVAAINAKETRAFMQSWPENRAMWLKPDGSSYVAGETIRLPNLAHTLERMVEAERAAARSGRAAGIAAARDRFYKGDIAREMVAFLKAHHAPWELDDFAEYSTRLEAPTHTTYRGYDVYKSSFNSQGPVLLEALNILEQFDLRSMKLNSAEYLHTIVEALKLAYADRESYYADPAVVEVPAEGLLSKAYAKERAKLIDPAHASHAFIAGNPLPFDSKVKTWPYWIANIADAYQPEQAAPGAEPIPGLTKDTTHIAVIDKAGNVFDATPSGAWIPTAAVLGKTGIPMSVRGEAFWLDKTHVGHLRPRMRPRYTISPSLVLRDGRPFLAIGTPGGDNQEQTILQTFLDIVEFWSAWYPNLHDAFDWPRVQTSHFYATVWPHGGGFNKLSVEATMPADVIRALRSRGHEVTVVAPFSLVSCATAVLIDPATNTRLAGADPRRDCYAMAY